mmetsp:Transcript_7818/g.23151  ORF Transcript_7818/g.23151 Transcript_7818/m.23151 type:complete len:267 (-) Transcript_7818:3135-3935(-)
MTARLQDRRPFTTACGRAFLSCCRENHSILVLALPPACGRKGGLTRSLSWPTVETSCGFSFRPPKFFGSRSASLTSPTFISSCNFLSVWLSNLTDTKTPFAGSYTSLKYRQMSPSVVRSMRPLTMRALTSCVGSTSAHLMIGVEIVLAALMISLIRGTPSVTFMLATPAKWNVFSVICVAGSAMDCAATAPTASPGMSIACTYFTAQRLTKASNCHCVGHAPMSPKSRASVSDACARAFAADSAVSPRSNSMRSRFAATPEARPLM